ncbi:type II toxin-antitoxin system VapB family antitoxin [Endozoicomonas sp. 4G]|uniref:type II toxin-antitoxin system VapB family antitoxin n=1 Tax=Endozoicomonas sp. 4G TaxID=2872754 RepID=UPI0020790283|nr:type II toxin-antitoxin system VapB family antitoxin [Endozoicomonas sp. 4G]
MSGTSIRTNIVIDQELMEEAIALTGHKTRKEVVNFALQELVRRARQKELLSLKGKIDWEGNLDGMRETR